MELPGNVYWEAGNVNSNKDTAGNGNWECGDIDSGGNSKPGLLPTPDKVSPFLPVSLDLSF